MFPSLPASERRLLSGRICMSAPLRIRSDVWWPTCANATTPLRVHSPCKQALRATQILTRCATSEIPWSGERISERSPEIPCPEQLQLRNWKNRPLADRITHMLHRRNANALESEITRKPLL
ncbi:hypothetical protein BD414DRAFT_490574 [Trametes punicea]|nr:hypothetical protein BD414DRAFT_490574 [Trametes punicea]